MKKIIFILLVLAVVFLSIPNVLIKTVLVTAIDINLIYVKDTHDRSYEVVENVEDLWTFKKTLLSARWEKNKEDCDCSSMEYLQINNRSLWSLLDIQDHMIEVRTRFGKYYIYGDHIEDLFPEAMQRR